MKKLLLLTIALLTFNVINAQVNINVETGTINTLTVDVLHSGSSVPITYSAMDGLGIGGHVEIYGNLAEGRIDVTIGVGSVGNYLCRINFPEGYTLDTDNATIFIQSYDGSFFEVLPRAIESNGFEIMSKNDWTDYGFYEFRYFIISHL